jgi:hypothetical protein
MYWRAETMTEEGREQSRPFVFSLHSENGMATRRYQPGDNIVLKPGIFAGGQAFGAGRIVSVLPAAQGLVHYRVRFQNENYERSIRQDDIDVLASPSSLPPVETQARAEAATSSWINANAIRIRK